MTKSQDWSMRHSLFQCVSRLYQYLPPVSFCQTRIYQTERFSSEPLSFSLCSSKSSEKSLLRSLLLAGLSSFHFLVCFSINAYSWISRYLLPLNPCWSRYWMLLFQEIMIWQVYYVFHLTTHTDQGHHYDWFFFFSSYYISYVSCYPRQFITIFWFLLVQ